MNSSNLEPIFTDQTDTVRSSVKTTTLATIAFDPSTARPTFAGFTSEIAQFVLQYQLFMITWSSHETPSEIKKVSTFFGALQGDSASFAYPYIEVNPESWPTFDEIFALFKKEFFLDSAKIRAKKELAPIKLKKMNLLLI